MEAKKKPLKAPDMGTYKPAPVEYSLFENATKARSANKSDWNKDIRFDLPVPGAKPKESKGEKSKSVNKVPGPGHYQMVHKWHGKDDVKKHPRDYMEAQSKPTSKSVYYH